MNLSLIARFETRIKEEHFIFGTRHEGSGGSHETSIGPIECVISQPISTHSSCNGSSPKL